MMSSTLWACVALGYVLAAIYLQAFDDDDHPLWVWGPFYAVGSAILLLVNRSFFLAPDGTAAAIVEYIALLLVLSAGIAMFWLAEDYARYRRQVLEARERDNDQTTLTDHDHDD